MAGHSTTATAPVHRRVERDTNVYSHWPVLPQQPFDRAQWERICRRMLDEVLPQPLPVCIWRVEAMGTPAGGGIDTWILNAEKNWNNGARAEALEIIHALERQGRGDARQRLRLLCLPALLHLYRYEVPEAEALFAQIAAPALRQEAEVQLLEAAIQFRKNQLNSAFKIASAVLETVQKNRNQELEMRAQELLGRISRDVFMGASLKAIPFHEISLAMALERGDTTRILTNLWALADNYGQAGQNALYVAHLEQLVDYLQRCPLIHMRARSAAMIAIFSSDPARTTLFLEKALRLTQQLNIRSLIQNNYLQLLDCFLIPSKVEYAAALLDSALLTGIPIPENELQEYYYKIEKLRGHSDLALKHLEKAYHGVGDAYMKRTGEQVAEWETRLRTRETELQLEEQKRQAWLLIGLALAFGGLFAAAAIAYWQQKKARQKIAEQSLLIENQAAALRRLDEAKSRFFANVSHELRTPLTLILGPLASLLKSDELSARHLSYTKTAHQHAQQLLNLVQEILDLSKMESRKMKLHETTVSLQPFLRRVVSAFESHAERLGIRFSFEYRAPQRLRVALDADKIAKVVNNLLSNAMKFTPPGGRVEVLVDDAENCIRLMVCDTGRGIHPDDLPLVFDRYYQSNQSHLPIEGGTGIGLALCRELAELMQGRIWAESVLNEGSRFYFEFPKKEVLGVGDAEDSPVRAGKRWANADRSRSDDERAPEISTGAIRVVAGRADDQNPPTAPPSAVGSILLVEDNHSLRDYLALVLSDKYRVITAENGDKALRCLADCGESPSTPVIDLIISDIMMPVMDGFQLLENLKKDARYAQIPVIMLTARADARDKLQALRAGVDDYLLKPFEEDELLARIANLMKNDRLRRQSAGMAPVQAPAASPRMQEVKPISPVARPAISVADLAWLADLEKRVENALGNLQFSAEDLATQMLVSRSQFFTKVKHLTGMTPNEYVQEIRFRHARLLLETRQVTSVKALAAAVGIRKVDYFSRMFRERFGKSPSEYLN